MTEIEQHRAYPTEHGWNWDWLDKQGNRQGFAIQRTATLDGRGSVMRVWSLEPGPDKVRLEIYLSEGGRSLRVWRGNKELVEVPE